jgi:hypothetical protein
MQERMFVKADLELKESILAESQSEFLQRAYEVAGKEKPQPEETADKKITSDKQWEEYGVEAASKAKKLYREISKKAHPDKDTAGIYADVFAGAAVAYDECRLFDLYEYCDLLGVSYEMTDVEITAAKADIEEKREQAKVIESSFAYLWSIHENEKIREIIVKQFVKAVGGKL